MKRIYAIVFALVAHLALFAQQLPDPHFEDWSASFDGESQLKYWHGSNVSQAGIKFTLMYRKSGRSGYCAYVADKKIGALGITEVAPGYFSLGEAWQYLDGLKVNSATAGTTGGIQFAYRPDSVSVWIKRTGNDTDKEDFHILYYSWSGTAKGSSYLAKGGSCTKTDRTNEESDIRIALDHNECGTSQKANQVAEGWLRARAKYDNWTQVKVPIYYMNSDAPQMCNLIFSCANYPAFRANSGLYEGNDLYVDDVELIYSSLIQTLYIGDKEWKGFDPNSSEEQVYSLGEGATTIPAIEAWRGKGQLTNTRNETVTFNGRKLSGSEIAIVNGQIDGAPTTITVNAEDGKSSHVYKIKFVRTASANANLAGIEVNGKAIAEFRPAVTSYLVTLPYGTTATPVVTATAQEDNQSIQITQPASANGTATIRVTAPNQLVTKEYTVTFQVAQLSDNTLKNILVNGESVPGYTPSLTMYKVSLPLGTTKMPTVQAVSAYADGAQTIVHTVPDQIDGGTYQIAVSTPGNPNAKIYKLNFKLEASSYSYLKSLSVANYAIDFDPTLFTYYVNLPLGTTSMPAITYEPGDPYQTIVMEQGGVDGTTTITVTAADGSKSVYKVVMTTEKSEYTLLGMIYLNGQPLADFDKDMFDYSISLPIGTTALPKITFDAGDEYQTVQVMEGGLNGITRLSVVAQNGNSSIYQIKFSVQTSSDASLRMIYIDGVALAGFDASVLEYDYVLPQGTTVLPNVTYDQGAYQTITVRDGGVNGDYKITVRPQTGSSQTYKIHFSVATSSNTALVDLLIDGVSIASFHPDTLHYVDSLAPGITTIPTVTFVKAEESERVLSVLDNTTQTITVTAENGDKRVYVIDFIIQKSENALLQMIYLNGEPLAGFAPDVFHYEETLQTATCPAITVAAAAGQQVIITMPYAMGDAQITVIPETGASNVYVIHFNAAEVVEVELNSILLDGQVLEGFQSNRFTYDVTYRDSLPTISWEERANQTVQQVVHGDTVQLYVASSGKMATYTLTFSRTLRSDASLKAILLDDVLLASYLPTQTDYTLSLPAGSMLPTITCQPNHPSQTIALGQVTATEWLIQVVAEDGTTNTYTLHFEVAPYTDVVLAHLALSNGLLTYDPAQRDYEIAIDEGASLPDVWITTKPGQSTLLTQTNANEQQILVTAQNGDQATYTITYRRLQSSNSLLKTILIAGDTLADFAPDRFTYTYPLPFRTAVVPMIEAVGQIPNQTITTYFSQVNGTTRIHVVSADTEAESEYTIFFPVAPSTNTQLGNLVIDTEEPFVFDPEQTDYRIALPYNTKEVPAILFEKAEQEQQLSYISRPLGDTSLITVTAQNGDSRTYRILCYALDTLHRNALKSIYIKEAKQYLDLSDASQRAFSVVLPYGVQTFTIEYEKIAARQTVVVENGGILRPSTIRLKGLTPVDADEEYTITPIRTLLNPAVLSGITVDGESVANFDANRFTYIVNRPVSNVPFVSVSKGAGVECNVQTNMWQSTITVSKDGYTNRYEVVFHYVNDVIPNNHFTEWTTTAKSKSDKPTHWNAPGDYLDVYLSTAKASETVSKDGSSVHMKTRYWAACGGAIPAIINLGSMSASFAVGGGTRVIPSGYIGFHNTPDLVVMNYKYPDKSEKGALFRYTFYDENGAAHTYNYRQTVTSSSYEDHSLALPLDGLHIMGMDVVIDAAGNYTKEAGKDANLYVDYVRYAYNNRLSSLKVNEVNASIDNLAITATLSSSEQVDVPTLTFVGEVRDQAQKVVWQSPVKSGANEIRKATITNYGEDGQYLTYTLTVNRPLSDNADLETIYMGEEALVVAGRTDMDYYLAANTVALPDVQPIPTSVHQRITVTTTDSVYSIVVTPEYGPSKTYTIHLKRAVSDDTSLADITGVTDFMPDQRTYTIEAETMPDLRFTKQSDGQTVVMENGVFTVIAEDGSKGTYTVTLTPPSISTSAQITTFAFNGEVETGLGGINYDIERERPQLTAFVRKDSRDSVIYTQTATKRTWEVIGAGATHTYTLTYPAAKSNNALLSTIWVNGQPLEDFVAQIKHYTLYSDSALAIAVSGVDEEQTIVITSSLAYGLTYLIDVTAADGVAQSQYQVQVLPVSSDVATLKGIYLNDVLLDGFRADSFQYVVMLPTALVKVAEPQMPSLSYEVSDARASVQMELGQLNGMPTYFTVRSGNGSVEQQYEVLVVSEKSHNADLSAIVVNGVPVDRFESGRHYYSASTQSDEVVITWASSDRFQTATLVHETGNEYTIHVVAQDEVTMQDYVVEVYQLSQSNDATLKEIWLNGYALVNFEPALNPNLLFSPMQNTYAINLAEGATRLPQVSASMQVDGQTLHVSQTDWSMFIEVTAVDGITTNTYTLNFSVPLSSNANLSMIFFNDEPISSFVADEYYYHITLPVGYHDIPQLAAQKGQINQTVGEPVLDTLQGKATIHVTAEDGHTTTTYNVVYAYTLSMADTLPLITAVGDTLPGYRPTTFFYHYRLPVGTSSFPELDWEMADAWQTVMLDTVLFNEKQLTRQITAISEAGTTNVYTIAYEITYSAVDTLRMIYVDGKPISNFDSYQTEYTVLLDVSDTSIPLIDYSVGDEYQTVDVKTVSVGSQRIELHVRAQSGSTRTYTIYFSIQPSTETRLEKIYVRGELIANYSPDQYFYRGTPLKCYEDVPMVTVQRKESGQKVEIMAVTSEEYADTVYVKVTAEDRRVSETYTIVFEPATSDNFFLHALLFTDGYSVPFDSLRQEYSIAIPYGVDTVPTVIAVASDNCQTIEVGEVSEVDAYTAMQTITVYPYKNALSYTYTITYHFLRNTDAQATMIYLASEPLAGFATTQYEYALTYQPGTDEVDLYTTAQVKVTLSDPQAAYVLYEDEQHTLYVEVMAQDGVTVNTYMITQTILPSGDNYLSDILLNEVSLRDFDPETLFYVYYIPAGGVAPQVDAIARDERATVDIKVLQVGDTTSILCTAQDGQTRKYGILFAYSTINEAQTPVASDVLIKRLPGTNQILVASLRTGVSFSLYDQVGRQVVYVDVLPVCDQNDAIIQTLANEEVFADVEVTSAGTIIDVNPKQIYLYSFQDHRRVICGGKLMMLESK